MSNTIELTDRQRNRIESIKEHLKDADPNLPKPDDEHVIGMLLDSYNAIQNGYYEKGSEGEYPVALEFRDWMRIIYAVGLAEGDFRGRGLEGEANRYDSIQTEITEQLKE